MQQMHNVAVTFTLDSSYSFVKVWVSLGIFHYFSVCTCASADVVTCDV